MNRKLRFEGLDDRRMFTAGAIGSVGAVLYPTPAVGSIIFTPNETPAQIQQAVNNAPTYSKFYFDAGTYHNVSIVPKTGDSFTGQHGTTLAATTALSAFNSYGNGGGNHITLTNLIVTGYQANYPTGFPVGAPIHWTSPPYAAIMGGDYYTINHCDIENSKSAAVKTMDGSLVQNCILSNNGQEGIEVFQYPANESTNAEITVRNNVIANNNLAGTYSQQFEAGGFKAYDVDNVTFVQNTVSGNNGNGVWMDTNCWNTTINNNLVTNNTWVGINIEICGTTLISGNVITGNATTPNPQWPSAGIQMQDAENVTVTNNYLSGNVNTIILFSSQRTDLGINWTLTNIQFTGNTLIANQGIVAGIADAQNTGSNPYAPGNVVFKGNNYQVSGSAGFIYKSWLYIDETLAQWEAQGNS